MSKTHNAYALGRFTLTPHRQLSENGKPLAIGGKALDLLSALAAADGALVTKDELLNAVWPGVIVEENAIHVHISAARKLLADEAWRVETVYGKGYRLEAIAAARPDPPPSSTALQDEIAAAIAATRLALPESPHGTMDQEAFDLCVKATAMAGRATPQGLLTAIDLHERAIARDPRFVRAWTGLAGTLLVAVATGVLPLARRADARSRAQTAIALDPHNAAPLAIRASLDAMAGRWQDAATDFERARQLGPEDAVVIDAMALNVAAPCGHLIAASALNERARTFAPVAANFTFNAAHFARLRGDMAAVAGLLDEALLLGLAEDRIGTRLLRSDLALSEGRFETAGAFARAALGACPPLSSARSDELCNITHAAFAGGGDRAGASAAIERFIDATDSENALWRYPNVAGHLLNWQIRLGGVDAAYRLAARMTAAFRRTGEVAIPSLHHVWRPEMRAFREDPRFDEFVEALGFPPYWRRFGPPDGYRLQGDRIVADQAGIIAPSSDQVMRGGPSFSDAGGVTAA